MFKVLCGYFLNAPTILLGVSLIFAFSSHATEVQKDSRGVISNQSVNISNSTLADNRKVVATPSQTDSSLPTASIRTLPSDSSLPYMEEIYRYSNEDTNSETVQNVTSISQLSDIKPTDWAFTALQSLTERYGCIAGYPERTYRGHTSITRYEFTAAVSACLDKINEIISTGLADKVSKSDLATLQKLTTDFATELATLKSRVDFLESKTSKLDSQKFSATTKLNVIAAMNITGASAGSNFKREVGQRNPITKIPQFETVGSPNVTFSHGIVLSFVSSFTGKDLLVNALAVGNGSSPTNVLASAGLAYTWGAPFTDQTITGTAPSFGILESYYQVPIFGDKARLRVGQTYWLDIFDKNRFTSIFNNGGSFNTINSPLASPVKYGTGVVLMSSLGEQLDLSLGYLADASVYGSASNPKAGLFGGANVLSAQLTFKPSNNFNLRFLYNRSNQPAINGLVGLGGTPVNGLADDGVGGNLNNAQSNTYVVNFDWLINDGFGLFGRYAFSDTNLNPANPNQPSGSLSAQAFQIGMAFPELFSPGALATIAFAMPINYTSGKKYLVSGAGDGGTQYDLELSYLLPLSRNITITPNLYVIFNPNNFSSNPSVIVGNLRMMFFF